MRLRLAFEISRTLVVEQGVFGGEEVGFARITDSAGEAVDLVVRSLPPVLKSRLHPIEARVV
jgi:hypothetical protein